MLVAAGLLSVVGYKYFQNRPRDQSQLLGSHTGAPVTTRPPIASSSWDSPGITGLNAEVANPSMRVKRPKYYYSRNSDDYKQIMPNSSFEVESINPNSHSRFEESLRTSYSYLTDHPAPVSLSSRTKKNMPMMIDARGRALQYSAAADIAPIATLSISRFGSGNKSMPRFKTDYSKSIKSAYFNSLLPGTVPAYGKDPNCPSYSDSAFTKIYTGKKENPGYY